MLDRITPRALPALAVCIGLASCVTPKALRTDTLPLVPTLDIERYSGTWYEIARLPNSFEKGLDRVTATYTIRDDGRVEVLNRGYNTRKGTWSQAKAKAWIPRPDTPALLSVSFFPLTSSAYRVLALDDLDYSYAMVTSSSKKYLWVLSRTSTMDDARYAELVERAREWGFPVQNLYRVQH